MPAISAAASVRLIASYISAGLWQLEAGGDFADAVIAQQRQWRDGDTLLPALLSPFGDQFPHEPALQRHLGKASLEALFDLLRFLQYQAQRAPQRRWNHQSTLPAQTHFHGG